MENNTLIEKVLWLGQPIEKCEILEKIVNTSEFCDIFNYPEICIYFENWIKELQQKLIEDKVCTNIIPLKDSLEENILNIAKICCPYMQNENSILWYSIIDHIFGILLTYRTQDRTKENEKNYSNKKSCICEEILCLSPILFLDDLPWDLSVCLRRLEDVIKDAPTVICNSITTNKNIDKTNEINIDYKKRLKNIQSNGASQLEYYMQKPDINTSQRIELIKLYLKIIRLKCGLQDLHFSKEDTLYNKDYKKINNCTKNRKQIVDNM